MTTPSLSARFAALHAERERTWPAAQLAKSVDQRRILIERDAGIVRPQAGERLASFSLIDAEGRTVASTDLLQDGPLVLVFFRFGGCPACNIALPYYDETLWPALDAAGVRLVAVSAQVPVDPGPTERHGLRFPAYGDPGYALARALHLTFFPEDQPEVAEGAPWIGATLGTNSYEMTQPAVIVLEPDHTIRFIEVSPDWLNRTESATILAHVPEAALRAA